MTTLINVLSKNQGNIFENQSSNSGQNIFGMFDNKNQATVPVEQPTVVVEQKEETKKEEKIDLDIPGLEEYG